MVKVVHVITSLSNGGAERSLFNLLSSILNEDECHFVVNLRGKGVYSQRIRDLGVEVFECDLHFSWSFPKGLIALQAAVKKFKPDVIQGWMYHGNFIASALSFLLNRNPTVAWNIRHSLYSINDERFFTRQIVRLNRIFSSNAKVIIYNSQASCELHSHYGLKNSKSLIISNGFDTEVFTPNVNKSCKVRNELGLPDDGFVVGHVGRFHPMKDHLRFLKAAIQVTMMEPRIYFVLIGKGVDIHNADLLSIIPQRLLNRFIFVGEQNNVLPYMQAMDVLCSSSWSEAFPNAVGEAMACEVPCIVTDVGDSAHLVGNTGIVIPPKDVNMLINSLIKIFKLPTQERKLLGKAARIRIVQQFNLESCTRKYRDLYRDLSSNF